MALGQGIGGLIGAMGGGAGISQGLQAASPLLMAMSAGLSSGQGAASQMPLGLMLMQQQRKLKQETDAKTAAQSAYGSWNAGTQASGIPATMGAQNAPTGPLAGAMASPERFSPAPSRARGMDEMFAQTEQQFQLPEGYLARTAQIESGGNPNSKNPKSSAGGLFQFIDSTAKQYGVDKFDPASATEGAARLAADNAQVLRQTLGREPTAGELYLAHQQGAGGAAKLLANPNARAADIVGAAAVKHNGGDVNMTAGDFAAQWQQKFGPATPADPSADPQVRGMIDWLANYGETDPSRAAAVKMQLQMRIEQIQAQSAGQGITDAQAAQFGLQEAGQQPQPMSPAQRYQSVAGVGLVDLAAEGGPRPVLSGQQDPMSGAGKLMADLDAGRITQEQFDAEMSKGNMSFSTNPDGTASFSMGGGQRLKPLTEGQSKDNYYLTSIDHAGPILDQYEASLVGLAGAGNATAGAIPGIGKFMQSEGYQQAQQAVAEWGAPVLRKESGAALTSADYEWLTSRYIPVPGDKPATIAQKRQARMAAEAGIRSGMTDEQVNSVAKALKSLRPELSEDQLKAIAQETEGYTGAPEIGAVDEGHVYIGGDPNDMNSWRKR